MSIRHDISDAVWLPWQREIITPGLYKKTGDKGEFLWLREGSLFKLYL